MSSTILWRRLVWQSRGATRMDAVQEHGIQEVSFIINFYCVMRLQSSIRNYQWLGAVWPLPEPMLTPLWHHMASPGHIELSQITRFNYCITMLFQKAVCHFRHSNWGSDYFTDSGLSNHPRYFREPHEGVLENIQVTLQVCWYFMYQDTLYHV